MNLRTLLRASLIPLGASLVMHGLQDLRTEADDLAELVDARRAYLAGDGPLPEVDEPEPAADDEHQAAAGESSPEDFPRTATPAQLEHARFPVRPRHVAAAVAGLALGWVAVSRWQAARSRVEQAAAMAAARSALLVNLPPAPGSPADLATPAAAFLAANRRPCKCGAPIGPDGDCLGRVADESYDDEDQAADADPAACPDCAYAPWPTRTPSQRAVDLTLHRNRAHAAGLPGR